MFDDWVPFTRGASNSVMDLIMARAILIRDLQVKLGSDHSCSDSDTGRLIGRETPDSIR